MKENKPEVSSLCTVKEKSEKAEDIPSHRVNEVCNRLMNITLVCY
jgi:hypothetical protein